MLLIQSPSIIFALISSFTSILLAFLTFNIGYNHPQQQIQFLIILPPINSIFLFLLSLTWIERRFRLSYIPFICLIILLFSSLTLTIISSSYLSSSIIIYLNFILYTFFTILFFFVILILIISYLHGSLYVHRYQNRMTTEQQNNQSSKSANQTLEIDQFILKSNDNELVLFMSKLPGRRIRHDIRHILDDLREIHVDTILTLNETKEFSTMTMSNNNSYDMDSYSMHIKRANIEHLIYSIRNHFIPKSISDYMQYLYSIIINLNRSNQNRLLVHCLDGMGRTGMTIVCFELLYEYILNENERDKKQNFLERICHYPFLMANSCRVCQSISNVKKLRPTSISNPLQILFLHEFYARIKSPSYMEQIQNIIQLHEKFLLNTFDQLHLPINIENN